MRIAFFDMRVNLSYLRCMATIVSGFIGRDHYTTALKAGKHLLTGDEPLTEGGADLGPNPYEFILLGLATCTCATLRMYADRQQIALDEVHVRLTMEVFREAGETKTVIKKEIDLKGDGISAEQKNKLLMIADKCPVHRLLEGDVRIEQNRNAV